MRTSRSWSTVPPIQNLLSRHGRHPNRSVSSLQQVALIADTLPEADDEDLRHADGAATSNAKRGSVPDRVHDRLRRGVFPHSRALTGGAPALLTSGSRAPSASLYVTLRAHEGTGARTFGRGPVRGRPRS